MNWPSFFRGYVVACVAFSTVLVVYPEVVLVKALFAVAIGGAITFVAVQQKEAR